ncbi:hypothetical protein CRUP_009577 [Coryphaenoides rupestris]|nr:hypothetical protein CRUP_009577 [Coryphaenoides rupestris]
MSGTAKSNKRVCCPSPGGASPADKRAKVETSGAKRRRSSSPKPTPACGKRRRTDVTSLTVGRPAGIQDLPPEIMEVIMGHLSPQDLTSLGATCSRFHQQIQNRWVWRRVCGRMRLDHLDPGDWRRMAILKDTQALHVHQLVKRPRRPSTSRAVDIPLSTGYRRVVPISDGVLLLDYQCTLHILRRDGSAGALGRPTTFCHDVKDFAVDPCSNTSYRGLVYVVHGTRHPCVGSCEMIVYLLANGRCISHSMFDASLDFVQIRLTGTEKDRCLQILTAILPSRNQPGKLLKMVHASFERLSKEHMSVVSRQPQQSSCRNVLACEDILTGNVLPEEDLRVFQLMEKSREFKHSWLHDEITGGERDGPIEHLYVERTAHMGHMHIF